MLIQLEKLENILTRF